MTTIVDRKLEGPWRITFDTNPDTCNLHCRMCEERSPYRKEPSKKTRLMELNTIEKVIKSTSNHGLKEIIPSTMGEPLLYPDMKRLIELIKKYKLKINLTTNGTFPILGPEKWGNILLPIASDVKVSINGATKDTAEKIMIGTSFEKQLSHLHRFIQIRNEIKEKGINNPTITFQVTYMESNLNELPALLKFAIENGVDRFKGHHLWVTWPELEEELLLRDVDSRRRWNKTVDELNKIANNFRLENGNKIRLDNVYRIPIKQSKSVLKDDWLCPFLGREAWIAWDGTFNVCCSPDEHRRTLGYYGTVNETDIMDLWKSPEYETLIKGWGEYKVCKNCNMRRPPQSRLNVLKVD
jgi:MoaA/NifB/PqqE/SkfB family radical SAM enzyme